METPEIINPLTAALNGLRSIVFSTGYERFIQKWTDQPRDPASQADMPEAFFSFIGLSEESRNSSGTRLRLRFEVQVSFGTFRVEETILNAAWWILTKLESAKNTLDIKYNDVQLVADLELVDSAVGVINKRSEQREAPLKGWVSLTQVHMLLIIPNSMYVPLVEG